MAHLDWFGCLKFTESNFAGGEIEFVSASSLFSPNKNIWLEDDLRRGLRHFVPEPALAQNRIPRAEDKTSSRVCCADSTSNPAKDGVIWVFSTKPN